MTAPATFSVPQGIVGITTYGVIQTETAFWLAEARSHAESLGLKNIQYHQIHGTLVDKARNELMRRMLAGDAQWVLMLDGDMVGGNDVIARLLETAFGTHRHFDCVGAYCTLRGGVHLPTIDTGTGTWESHYPGTGPMEVMRTGGACLLIKRHVIERIPDPWFALRVPMKPLDAIAETDNFCRTIFDGRNPFRGLPNGLWEQMEQCAQQHPSNRQPWVPGEVGEDSSFCDRVTHAGFRIAVDTNIVVQHLVKIVHGPDDHRKAMLAQQEQERLTAGLVA